MNPVLRLLVITLLLLFAIAPFAGLAPLPLVMLAAGAVWIASDWLRTLQGKNPAPENDEGETVNPS
jgi:hypothetical protein